MPDTANLLVPNPRTVSRELMTREQFQPATILNLLAAAWIQFMVHDWFVHERSKTEFIDVPTQPGDDFGALRVPRSVPESAPAGSTRPPAYANLNSHWWDASQIYGCDREMAAKLRTQSNGKLRIEPTGLLPVDPKTGVHFSGFTDNWWIGLAMLHTLFTLEHNYIADLLAHQNPRWTDEQLFRKAKLINSALMAKIHTIEWTPAIVPNPIIATAMNVNWSGLAGEDLQDALAFLDDKELLGGIVGSHADHHTAPYSLTEEFVSVYRMHPLIPDEYAFHSAVTGRLLEKRELPELSGRNTPAIAEHLTMADLFYSFGTCHPGAVTLHNYPRHLQNLTRDDGEHLDLAAVDILRDRERGVPRYNQFRRLLHKDPVKSFDELTDNPAWRKQLRDVYTERSREGRPDDGALCRAAAARLRVQRDGIPHLHPDGLAPAEERSLLHRRLPPGGLHRARHRLRPQELDAARGEASLPAARTRARRREERVRAVETDRRPGGGLVTRRAPLARKSGNRRIATHFAAPHHR